MRLINTATLQLESFLNKPPPYAVLSHTWVDGEEVTFQEMQTGAGTEKSGYLKIKLCCSQAKTDGLGYAWVDTCCIDKTSSSELSESINSMFRWYEEAETCYAFLADVHESDDTNAFIASRWFSRGWTLQELLAPSKVIFYTSEWLPIGDREDLSGSIERITTIDQEVLTRKLSFSDVSVAERMTWAARRQTTRGEDMAYSLLGIFGVSMSLLYGEGGPEAFRRLQEEIVKTSNDLSIFAWLAPERSGGSEISAFSTAVSQFAYAANVPIIASSPEFPTEVTGGLIKVHLPFQTIKGRTYGLLRHYSRPTPCVYGIPLEEIHPNVFVRLRGQVVVVEYSGFLRRDQRSVSLVIRLEKYRETARARFGWDSYRAVMFKSLPPEYRITEITPFDTRDVKQDTIVGLPFMARGSTWVELRHVTDKHNVFIFRVHRTFGGKENLQSSREEWVYPAHNRDAALCPLEEFGNRLVERPIFTSLFRSDEEDPLRVHVSIRAYAAYELHESIGDVPSANEFIENILRASPDKPWGSAPWIQEVLVVEVTSTPSFGRAAWNRVAMCIPSVVSSTCLRLYCSLSRLAEEKSTLPGWIETTSIDRFIFFRAIVLLVSLAIIHVMVTSVLNAFLLWGKAG
ncbi:acetyltransferase [Apiospora arundinis]